MKVLLSLTQLFHTVPGGTATSMVRLAQELSTRNEITLGLYGARGSVKSPTSMLAPSQHLTEWGLTGPWDRAGLPVELLYETWRRWGRPKPRSLQRHQMDLFHLTVPVTPPQLVASRHTSDRSEPFVATVHDVIPLSHPERFSPRGAALMQEGLRAIQQRAAAIFVPTQHVANQCVDHGFNPDVLHVVHHGVDQPSGQAVSLERFNLPREFVLFVGTQEPRKNLDRLITAMEELNARAVDIPLVIVGPDGWGDEPRRASNVEVIHLGRLSTPEVQAMYSHASVFAFPSLDEGFGLPVLEAMAGGVPVVTSQDSAMSEVAAGAAELCDPDDIASISAALEHVLTSSTHAAALRKAGHKRAAELTWDRAANLTISAYQDALDRLN